MADSKKIKLGICMAGAVSAGAYTAGVVDYLIETLERWQIAKDKIRDKLSRSEALSDDELAVPLHDLEIEVLSGASAGGMTASILMYSFLDGQYVTRNRENQLKNVSYGLPNFHDKKSKLYHSWVDMADDSTRTTLEKMLDTADVRDIQNMKSLLNCDAISEIADKACPLTFPEHIRLPKYISPDLAAYVTITNLDGLPIDIKFSNTHESKNQYSMHNMLIGFKYGKNKSEAHPCMTIGRSNYKKIKDFAIATGAFPFGLKPQEIRINYHDMEEYISFLKKDYGIDVDPSAFQGDDYRFTAVDGGLINNEPYGVNAKHLNTVNPPIEGLNTNFMLYVDPFPSVHNALLDHGNGRKDEVSLLNMFTKLFGAVRNQSMLKQDDLFHALNMDKNRFLIYPRKNRLYFLACGMLAGFSGFLKKEFRNHDYQLGRKNCQAFLRFYLGKEVAFFETIGQPLHPSAVDSFGYFPDRNLKLEKRIPLIPDMLFHKNSDQREIENPIYENLSKLDFEQIISNIGIRIKAIVEASYASLSEKVFNKSWALRSIKYLAKNRIKKMLLINAIKFMENNMLELVRPQAMTQKELLENYAKFIEKRGVKCYKSGKVVVRKANPNELVVTISDSGKETKKFAKYGDYVATNMEGLNEEYIIEGAAFEKYALVDKVNGLYQVKSENFVHAMQFTRSNFPELFKRTSWNEKNGRFLYIELRTSESQIVVQDDYLIFNGHEVYRIGKSEYEHTYCELT